MVLHECVKMDNHGFVLMHSFTASSVSNFHLPEIDGMMIRRMNVSDGMQWLVTDYVQ